MRVDWYINGIRIHLVLMRSSPAFPPPFRWADTKPPDKHLTDSPRSSRPPPSHSAACGAGPGVRVTQMQASVGP